MLPSDVIGAVASLLLIVAPARDQYYHFQEYWQLDKAGRSVFATLRKDLGEAWRLKRDAYKGLDTVSLGLGAMGLLTSFVLKLAGV